MQAAATHAGFGAVTTEELIDLAAKAGGGATVALGLAQLLRLCRKDRVDELAVDRAAARAEGVQVRQDATELRDELRAEIKELRGRTDELERAVIDLKRDLGKAQETIIRLELERARLLAEVEKQEGLVAISRVRIGELEQEIAAHKGRYDSIEREMARRIATAREAERADGAKEIPADFLARPDAG